MIPSSNLFHLVHTLTPQEKRYFRLFAARHVIGQKNNYEKLFDVIEALPADAPYDEEELKRSLKRKTWAKNFAAEKKNLEEIILQAMRAYHADKSPLSLMLNMISDIDYLLSKGIVDMAMKTWEKALKLAKEREMMPAQIMLYQYYQRMPFRLTDEQMDIDEAHFADEEELLPKLNLERKLSHIKSKVVNWMPRNLLGPKLGEIKQVLKEYEGVVPTTRLAYVFLLIVKAEVALTEGRVWDAKDLLGEIIKKYDDPDYVPAESSFFIITAFGNYLYCLYYCQLIDEMPSVIERVAGLPVHSFRDEADRFIITAKYKLQYLLNVPDKTGAVAFVAHLKVNLTKYHALVGDIRLMNFHTNFCVLLLQVHEYARLIDEVNLTYKVTQNIAMTNVHWHLLKFCEIIGHIGLKNYSLVEALCRNIERAMRERGIMHEYISELIKGLKACMHPDRDTAQIRQRIIEANCPEEYQMIKEVTQQWLAQI